jgi:hypothetical protein
MSTWHIYVAKNLETAECYVGRTTASIDRRRSWHYSNANKIDPDTGKYLNNSRFSIALRKYNKDVFEWVIIAEAHDINNSYMMEGFYIEQLDTMNSGYNEKPNDRVPWNQGKKMNEDYKNNLSGPNNPMYGKTHSDSVKKMQSERMKSVQLGGNNSSARKVRCTETGQTWNSIVECAAELNIKEDSIVANCRGKNRSAYGYHFEYIDSKISKRNIDVNGGNNPTAKSVICIEDNRCWKSATECANDIGVSPSMIHAVCRGKKNTAKGFHFKYITN